MKPKICGKCGYVVPDSPRVEYCAYCGHLLQSLEKCLDFHVRDLVMGLWRWEIKTEMSCEGHLDHGAPFPWVDVPYSEAEHLARVVSWQNRLILPDGSENKNTWVIRPRASLRLMPENRNRSLEEMREDAIEFGKFLQELPDDWDK